MFKLFGLISTKELYLLKLDVVAKFQYTSYFNGNYTLAFNPRYVLARKKDGKFIDVLTGTKYENDCVEGREMIVGIKSIITSKKHITKDEANFILKELNPTYLEAVKPKKLERKK